MKNKKLTELESGSDAVIRMRFILWRKPRLSVPSIRRAAVQGAIYHKQEDLWTIPQYIFELNIIIDFTYGIIVLLLNGFICYTKIGRMLKQVEIKRHG